MAYEKYELYPRYDARKSFYGKAWELYHEDGIIELRSYSTIVARIYPPGRKREYGYEDEVSSPKTTAEVYGVYSQTTLRHIKEFLKQHGFKAENQSQILKDYYTEN